MISMEYLEEQYAERHDLPALLLYFNDNRLEDWAQDDNELIEKFEDAYRGEYWDGAEYAEETYASAGYNLGELASYIDWNRVWRDMEMEGAYTLGGEHSTTKSFFICI